MSYASILVYLDSPEHARSVLSVAIELANLHDAHLTGLYVPPALENYVPTLPMPTVVTNTHIEYHGRHASEIQSVFEQCTRNQNFISEWRYADYNSKAIEDTVADLANACDLLVIGQKNKDHANSWQRGLPERIMLVTGRPTLLVPPDYVATGPVREVFVAFDDSPQVIRAVFDSLPILQQAESVTLHRVNPTNFEHRHVLGTGKELVTTLSRHGVNAELAYSDIQKNMVGDELLLTASEKGADLLVMGAYGHQRLGQRLFGGTTRTVLEKMKLPVLMCS